MGASDDGRPKANQSWGKRKRDRRGRKEKNQRGNGKEDVIMKGEEIKNVKRRRQTEI